VSTARHTRTSGISASIASPGSHCLSWECATTPMMKTRTISIDDIRVDSKDVSQQLLPMLRSDLVPNREKARLWSENLTSECRSQLSKILPFTGNEMEFLRLLNDKGEILPELVTEDPDLQLIILNHPGLLWKVQDVREHFRRGSHDAYFQDQNLHSAGITFIPPHDASDADIEYQRTLIDYFSKRKSPSSRINSWCIICAIKRRRHGNAGID